MTPSARLRVSAACLLAAALAVGGGRRAGGEDFLVENKVFLGSEEEAHSRSTTIFHDGMVYDYLEQPAEIIIFDKAGGRFVLLDTARKVRSELTTDTVARFSEQVVQKAADNPDPLFRFAADPKFEEQFDAASGTLTLSSPWMTYLLLVATTGSKEVTQQYREFADWYSRLNTYLQPGAKPAKARLMVNAALQKYQAFAREVQLTLNLRREFPAKQVQLRSRHQLIRQVSEADLDRVTQTRQFMDIYKPVSFEQYQQGFRR